MPLSKNQIAQRKNFKNRSNNSSTGQFEESKVSDSSDSDFILSDEIYSSDSKISQAIKFRRYEPSDETNSSENMNKLDDDINSTKKNLNADNIMSERKGTKNILNEKKFSVKEFQTRIQQRVHEKSLYASVVSKEIFVGVELMEIEYDNTIK
nr:3172_t:CDS:2 [Entrophospora candida]